MRKITFRSLFFLTLVSNIYAQSPDVLITEVFADPTPTKGLPEREFLELFNRTNESINLKGFAISYNSGQILLQDYILQANAYVIICKKEFEIEFQKYGAVLPVSSLSLLNDGSTLILRNPTKEIIQIVDYKLDWYTPKLSEGYALEMIDVNKSCLGKENWASSTAILGGTPGKANAISKALLINTGPILIKSEIDKNIITLTYSQNLDAAFLKNTNQILFEKSDIKINKNLSQVLSSPILTFEISSTIASQDKIAFKVKSPTNCLLIVGEDNEVVFYNLPKAKKGDLLLSEVLFNPSNVQNEFFELYNASEKALNLKGFSVNVKENEITSLRLLSSTDLIIKPKTFIVFSKDKLLWQDVFPNRKDSFFEMSSFPQLNNENGILNIISPDSILYDSFVFKDAFHAKYIINTQGVSLERVSFKISATLSSNVHSAAESSGFMTPALANSAIETSKTENVFFLENKTLINNDPIRSKVVLKYTMNALDYQASINIHNKEGRICRKLVANKSLGITGDFEWDGTDNAGQLLPVGYYFFQIDFRSQNKTFVQRVPVIVGMY